MEGVHFVKNSFKLLKNKKAVKEKIADLKKFLFFFNF